jgi:hypothetical protein
MRETTKKQLLALAVLAGLNILLSNVVSGDGHRLNGEVVFAHSPAMRRAAIVTSLFGIQFFAFLLGTVAALVPWRKKAYAEKWVTFSLWIALAIQLFFVIAAIVKLIGTWL